MKFLLVALNAKYIHSNPAIYSLRSFAGESLQKYAEIAEYTINHSLTEVLADIYRHKPDVIGLSCYIWNWNMMQELLRELPKLLPGVPIWLGGPEVSFDAPEILKEYPMVTGVMVGDGEATFRELLQYYVDEWAASEAETKPRAETRIESVEKTETETRSSEETVGEADRDNGERLKCIQGLCLPTGYNTARRLTDMSAIPFLYEDLGRFQNRIIYYESARGCPFRCSYCLSSIDKKVRLRDISVVKQELQFFLDNNVKQVKFVDRTFNCNHQHAMEIWRYILEHDNNVTNFHFEISADLLNQEEIELLRRMRPGLVQLEIGVQSVNPRTLEAIHRTMDLEKLERNVAAIREGKNIHQHLDLIAGLPYEDYESFGRSFDRVYHMQSEQLQLGFLKVLKGSEMYERTSEYGIRYLDQPPYEVLFTNWLSFEEVLQLKKIEEMVELYYNSGQFVHTLGFLQQTFTSPFRMYEALAAYYEQEGYFVNSPARSYRYHVLLSFADKYDKAHEDVYKELLTYDMYLRENMKSRPDFACDLQEHKEFIRAFYQQEVQKREVLPAYAAYDSKQLARMTHLEPFYYPVWSKLSHDDLKKAEEPTYILFDYQKRNPLTDEAQTIRR